VSPSESEGAGAPDQSPTPGQKTTRPGLRMFALTVAIVVVMVLGGVLLAWRGYNSRRDDALDDLGGRAETAAVAARRFFNERLSVLGSVASSPPVQSGDVDTISAELRRFASSDLGFDNLSFIDMNGRLAASSNPDATAGQDFSDRSYVQAVLDDGSPFISEGLVGRLTGEPIIILAVPVPGEGGEPTGILIATVHLERATEILTLQAGEQLQILDGEDMLIYDGEPLAEPVEPASVAALAVAAGEARAAPGLGGQQNVVVAPAPVRNARWQIVLTRPESDIGATARDAFVREVVLLGILGLLAIAGVWWGARRIDRLHRREVGHVGEMAALEKFTAALAAADSPAAVAEAVSVHAPAVLGTPDVEVAIPIEPVPDRSGGTPPGESLDADDTADLHRQSLIATMSEQTTLALERARSGAEVEHLAILGSALARATTTGEVIAAILDHGAVVDDVCTVRASVHDVERHVLRIVDRDVALRRPDNVTELPIHAAHPQAEAIRTGDLVAATDADDLRARFPDWADTAVASGIVAAVAAPFMLGNDPVLGAMTLTFDHPRRLDSRERALLSTVTRLGADALTRARRFEQEHRVADTLQASLQPERLPQVDGWRFTGITLAGEAGSSVGGDWYDVAVLPQGTILLSVGDVTGRGPVAAGVMGLVRAAVRALALSDPDPASILEHTDDLLRGSTVHQLATAWVGLLDPVTGQLRFASAGHVPPLVLGPDGRRFLDDSPGLLLGTGLPGSRKSSVHHVENDASIVGYTDGLCERRGESLEVGLKRMAVALGDGIGLDAAKVVRRLVGRPTADDIAIVVATRLPATTLIRPDVSVAAR
jgi:Stage II sporulation protein E (SpoIIE)/Cache domain